jgi:hypothetical protein
MENRLDQGIASELEAKRNEIESLRRRTNVVSLDLFGSAASREFRPEGIARKNLWPTELASSCLTSLKGPIDPGLRPALRFCAIFAG